MTRPDTFFYALRQLHAITLCLDWFTVLYQTRETVFHQDIQTPRRELKTTRSSAARGVWIADETLSGVFDISSESKQKLKVHLIPKYFFAQVNLCTCLIRIAPFCPFLNQILTFYRL